MKLINNPYYMVLKVENLNCWRGRRHLLNQVSLTLEPNKLLLIRGPNGCGKSTLLKILAGLREPDSGSIYWHNKIMEDHIQQQDFKWLGHNNGNQPYLTVYENLANYCYLTHHSLDNIDKIVEKLGLGAHKNKPVGQLSAGLNRRLAIARLLAGPSTVWFLDEPQTSLDQSGINTFESLLTDFLDNGGSVLMSSHQPLSIDDQYIKHLTLN